MADYTKTVTHGIYFDGGVLGVKADLDFITPMAHDLEIVAGRVLVTIRRPGAQSEDLLAGAVVQTLDMVQNVMATRGMVLQRDIDSSNGKLRIGDRKFRVERADCEFQPRIGDQLSCEGVRYDVLGPDDATLATSWVLWCRS